MLWKFLLLSGTATAAFATMPVAQQNAMVTQYCTVCHTDAHPNGGISFERFDAAKPDPGVVAMIVSKLYSKALGASGQALPDKATQDDFLNTLIAESKGSNAWFVSRAGNAATASIVQTIEPSSKENEGQPDMYRLTVSCNPARREGEMKVAWSPATPPEGKAMAATADGRSLFTYRIEGKETMGNGQAGTSGPGSIQLYKTAPTDKMPKSMALPAKSLSIENLFGPGAVEFPFDKLDAGMRRDLSACFRAGL
jgi:hypothetical protein